MSGLVTGLIVLDLLALRFGVNSRDGAREMPSAYELRPHLLGRRRPSKRPNKWRGCPRRITPDRALPVAAICPPARRLLDAGMSYRVGSQGTHGAAPAMRANNCR